MLLVTWNRGTKQVYLAQQTPDFKFNRLDREGGKHTYGRKWLSQSRYLLGIGEWEQIGPLNMVQWSK